MTENGCGLGSDIQGVKPGSEIGWAGEQLTVRVQSTGSVLGLGQLPKGPDTLGVGQ